MLAKAGGRSVFMQEGALANRDAIDATERVLRLASGELDRAYRLAGLILGDRHEAQDATQDALCEPGGRLRRCATRPASRRGSTRSS